MLKITDQTLARDIKEGTANPQTVSRYLLTNYTAVQLADALAEEMVNSTYGKPITLTKQAFFQHFRIAGIKMDENGNLVPEQRGQGRWKKED